jgi:hypothetical protein
MSLFKKHVNDPSQPGFNLGSITGALKGGGATGASDAPGTGGGLAGIIGGLAGLFGKK